MHRWPEGERGRGRRDKKVPNKLFYLTINFMLPVPEASVPAVEICSERSEAGITVQNSKGLRMKQVSSTNLSQHMRRDSFQDK